MTTTTKKAVTLRYQFRDFTEKGYRQILALAKKNYVFEPYGTKTTMPHVLWRHDVDFSMHRALELAQIEAQGNVKATYFLMLHSEFYNLFEKSVFERTKQIIELGHDIGLHFDVGFYPKFENVAQLEQKLALEKRILEDVFSKMVNVFSYHNPETGNTLKFDQDSLSGMMNAYGKTIRSAYSYCSDSNGYWKYRRLHEVLEAACEPKLHVLTHPAWWVPKSMSPRERISRCIDGRARNLHKQYDQLLKKYNRENIGK